MRRRILRSVAAAPACLALLTTIAAAKPRAPLPDTAFDGGVISAETLGRGSTIASNRGTAASGSENPASLEQPEDGGALYATGLIATRSRLPDDAADNLDRLRGRVLQYLSVGAEKGVLFFEPISRYHQIQIVDDAAGTSRDVELNATAIGFAGASRMKSGSFGLSIAYLYSGVNVVDMTGGTITSSESGTANGLRLNLGVRYPTGPAMWGLLVQNAPAFLWGADFKREQLPLKVRVGNTYRLTKGVLFSVDGERRFYREGGRSEDFIYVGNESFLGKRLVVRAGAFGTSLNKSEDRTLTAGLTISARNNTQISYAIESFESAGERVRRSIISVTSPFAGGEE